MTLKTWLACLGSALFGLLVGNLSAPQKSYVDGRMSGCKDMMNVVLSVNPLIAMAAPQCVVYKGDVAVQVGDKIYSLDGKKQLN